MGGFIINGFVSCFFLSGMDRGVGAWTNVIYHEEKTASCMKYKKGQISDQIRGKMILQAVMNIATDL